MLNNQKQNSRRKQNALCIVVTILVVLVTVIGGFIYKYGRTATSPTIVDPTLRASCGVSDPILVSKPLPLTKETLAAAMSCVLTKLTEQELQTALNVIPSETLTEKTMKEALEAAYKAYGIQMPNYKRRKEVLTKGLEAAKQVKKAGGAFKLQLTAALTTIIAGISDDQLQIALKAAKQVSKETLTKKALINALETLEQPPNNEFTGTEEELNAGLAAAHAIN